MKTDKGQFVVYPSVNRKINKPYKWIKDPFDCNGFAKMPDWIVKLLTVGEIIETADGFKISPLKEEAEKKLSLKSDETVKLSKRRTEDNTEITYLFEILNRIPNEIHSKYDYGLKLEWPYLISAKVIN